MTQYFTGLQRRNDHVRLWVVQGKEADVVFFSCVRARAFGQSSSIGFLADVRRMNVALSRARYQLNSLHRAVTLCVRHK